MFKKFMSWLGVTKSDESVKISKEEKSLYNYMYLKKDVDGKVNVREPEASVVAVGQVGLKLSKDQDSKQKDRLTTAKNIFWTDDFKKQHKNVTANILSVTKELKNSNWKGAVNYYNKLFKSSTIKAFIVANKNNYTTLYNSGAGLRYNEELGYKIEAQMAYKKLLKENELSYGAQPFYYSLSIKKLNKKEVYEREKEKIRKLNSFFGDLQYCCGNFKTCDIETFGNLKSKLIGLKQYIEKQRDNKTYNDCLKKLEEAHSNRLFEDYKIEFIKLKSEFDRKPDKLILDKIKAFRLKIKSDKNLSTNHKDGLEKLITEYKTAIVNQYISQSEFFENINSFKEEIKDKSISNINKKLSINMIQIGQSTLSNTEKKKLKELYNICAFEEKIKSFEREIKNDSSQIYEQKYKDICYEIKNSELPDDKKQEFISKYGKVYDDRWSIERISEFIRYSDEVKEQLEKDYQKLYLKEIGELRDDIVTRYYNLSEQGRGKCKKNYDEVLSDLNLYYEVEGCVQFCIGRSLGNSVSVSDYVTAKGMYDKLLPKIEQLRNKQHLAQRCKDAFNIIEQLRFKQDFDDNVNFFMEKIYDSENNVEDLKKLLDSIEDIYNKLSEEHKKEGNRDEQLKTIKNKYNKLIKK